MNTETPVSDEAIRDGVKEMVSDDTTPVSNEEAPVEAPAEDTQEATADETTPETTEEAPLEASDAGEEEEEVSEEAETPAS